MTILIIAAHPDDETLGCGGTIARHAVNKEHVHILILGEGITSRSPENKDNNGQISKLQENSRKAAKILGASSVSFESFPDNMFDSVPLLDIIKIIEHYIQKYNPHTIYTHHGGDLNIDHTITFRAVLTAARPTPKSSINNIYCFETLSSTDWSLGKVKQCFEPNLFIDITDFINIKVKAMEEYKSEICKFPHPRSLQAINALAMQRGSMAGLQYCEAFSIIREIK